MKRIAVTHLINITKCENQTMLNMIHKPKMDKEVKERQQMGIKDHKKFENLNNKYASNTSKVVEEMNNTTDKRCYVATAIFGAYSSETILLRKWRDDKLSKSFLGRLFVKIYYKISPLLLRVLPKWTSPITKYVLIKFIKIIR
jgi:hypothetical protein